MNARQWLERLVAFDTTSRHSNLEMIEDLRDALSGHGLKPWLAHNAEGSKANLFVTLPAADGGEAGGIVLSGHTDVVPVDGQNWTTDPFKLTERDGKLYGRGACDMKGYIATAMSLVPTFMSQPRKKPLHFAFSYDEEVGCVGAPVMLRALRERGIHPEGCIVGEPTGMQVVVAHKGINLFRCALQGCAAHSSLTPSGCNAIEYAARLIVRIREIADRFKAEGPYDNFFDVPFTTMTTNQIQGGIAVNTIPQACNFLYEFRNLPGARPAEIQAEVQAYVRDVLLPAMKAEFGDARIDIDAVAAAPALEASEQAAITELVRGLTRDNDTRKVAYGTEAGLFQASGIPTVVCGPGHIRHAHAPDEFVDIEQLDGCERFLKQLSQAC